MNSNGKRFKKIISVVLSIIILSSAVSLPAFAQVLIEQARYNQILNTDLQGDTSDPSIQQLAHSSESQSESLYEMSDEEKKEEYKKNQEENLKEYKTNRYIVKYVEEKSVPEFSGGGNKNENGEGVDSEKVTSAGIESSTKVHGNKNKDVAVIILKDNMNMADFKQALRSAGLDQNVEYIQPDFVMTVSADPMLSQQWGLEATQIGTGINTTVGADVINAWNNSTGEDIIIAVLDSGFDTSHIDLSGSFYTNANEIPGNGIDDDNNGYIDDVSGWDFFNDDNGVNDVASYYDQWHGTHIAGIIAAQKDNDAGIAGVSPGAMVLPIKIFEGGVAYTSDIVNAIAYADSIGASIINCSWGSLYDNPALEDAISNSDALFVCAAGNNLYNTDNYPVFPAAYTTSYDNVISVAAVDQSGKLCRFSNYGENTVDIAAPGQAIISTWLDDEYQSLDGTSMSAAYASGAAALVYAKGNYTTADAVKARLITSADGITGLQDKVIDGKILNCTYATGSQTEDNTTIYSITDNTILPEIIPYAEPSKDDYQQSGAENYVSYKESMSVARHGLQVVALDGKVYAIGGQMNLSGGYTNIVEAYDPELDSWSTVSSMQYARSYFGAVVYDGQIYVMGGKYDTSSYTNSMEVYNPSTDTWTTLSATMPVAMCAFSATLIDNTDEIYIVGGRNNYYINSVYDFDISTGAWTPKTSLSIPISDHVAFYYNGEICIEGGTTAGGTFTYSEYKYEVSTGATSVSNSACSYLADAAGVLVADRFISIGGINASNSCASSVIHTALVMYRQITSHMLTARTGLGAAVIDGKVYMLGGQNSDGVLSSMEMLDLGWQEKASLPEAINYFETVEVNGKLYAMGGEKLENSTDVRSKTIYVYDTANDTWDTLDTEMPVYAEGFSLTSAYGKIYLIGGNTAETSTADYTNSSAIYEYDPQTDVWTQKNTLSVARHSLSTTLYNGEIFITGGSNGSSLDTVESYNPITNTVTVKNDLPDSYFRHFSCVLNNDLYVFDSSACSAYKYDEASDTWMSLSPSEISNQCFIFTVSDSLYVTRIRINNANISSNPDVYKYLPDEDTFTYARTINDFGCAGIRHVATADNKAYFFSGNSYSTSLFKYEPPASAWGKKASITGTYGLGAAVIGGDIYIAGGNTEFDGEVYINDLSKYSESAHSFETVANMTYARGGLGLAEVGNKIYAIGGQNTSGVVAYVEEYDPFADAWTTKTAIPSATTEMAIASYNDSIYIFGGKNSSGTELSAVRIYNPSTNSWSTGTSMPTARYGCGAGVIDGKIYVAGGFINSGAATSVLEIYDPATNTWDTAKASLPTALGYAGVTASDSLFVIGGFNGYDEISMVFEYSPVLDEWLTWDGPNNVRYDFDAVMTSLGIYVVGGKNSTHCVNDIEFAPVTDLSSDYIHLGEDTINLSGNFSRTYTDLSYTAPGFNVEFSRTYNSGDTRASIISAGWTFGFQGSVTSAGNDAIVRLPNGSGHTFQKNSDGSYTALDSRSTLEKQTDGAYILTTKDQYAYGFNTDGYLSWMRDRSGNEVNITVNSSGQVTQVTDQVGRITTIAYNNDRIDTITDPAGRVVTYSYDGNDRLDQVIKPDGISTYYYYDLDGYLDEITDNEGNSIESITYKDPINNETPKVDTVADRYGNLIAYVYDENEGQLITTDSNGRTNTTWYDNMIYPIRTRDAEGKETRAEYSLEDGLNHYGEVIADTDRNGNTTYYQRDENGNVETQINPDNTTKVYTYDDKNNVTSVKDESNKMTYYVYDANGINLLKTAQPLNGTDVFGVAPDANFVITENEYYTGAEALSQFGQTIYGLLETTTDPEGGETTYTYDSNGYIASIENAELKTMHYDYNELGWLKSVTTPKGNTTSYYYDYNGNLLKQVNPDTGNGHGVVRNVYNFRGDLTQSVEPEQYVETAGLADTTVTFDSEHIQSSVESTYSDLSKGYRYAYLDNGLLETVTDPCGFTTEYTYDLYGNKFSETKPNGAVYEYTYTAMDLLDTVTFKETAQSSYEKQLQDYDYGILPNGNTTLAVTQNFSWVDSARTTTTYDWAGRAIRVDQADETYTTTDYNANGTVDSTTDARGNTTHYEYDGLNRLVQQWSPVEEDNDLYSYTLSTYDDAGRVLEQATCKDLVGYGAEPYTNLVTTSFVYNADGTIKEEHSSSGAWTEYSYDDDGNVEDTYVYYDATNSSHESYAYNEMGQLETKSVYTQERDIEGYTNTSTELILEWSYDYDLNGNLYTETNSEDVTTTYGYDHMNRRISTSQPGEDENGQPVTITTYAWYNWSGNYSETVDELNNWTYYDYDERGNLRTIMHETMWEQVTQFFVYDWAGRKTVEVSPNNFNMWVDYSLMNRTEYYYDGMNRVVQVIEVCYDPDSGFFKDFVSAKYEYDGNGNVLKSWDALGDAGDYGTEYKYDDANRLIEMTDPEGQQDATIPFTMQYTYDGLGRVLTQTDANNVDTVYTYDDDGNVLTITVDGTLVQSNTYDRKGNVLTSTDGEDNVTSYTYNDLGSIRSMTLPGDASIPSLTTTYKYTKLGQVAESLDSMDKQQLITYDNQGRVLTTTERKSSGRRRITTLNTYDKAGNLRFATDGNGNTTEYTYDELNRNETVVVTVTDVNDNTTTQTTTYTYDDNGNKLTEQNWRGNTYTYTYDPLDRLILSTDPNGKTIEELEYDNNGNQTQSKDALGNTTQFFYDRNNRLWKTTDAEGHSQYQHYDGVGNVVQSVDANGNVTNFEYDGFNRLIEVENALDEITSYTYDDNGNLLTQTDGENNVATITYNCRNLPVQRIDPEGILPDESIDETKAIGYTYNADGSVATVIDKNGVTTSYDYDIYGRLLSVVAGGETISYTYDNNGNQLKVTNSEGTITRTYDEVGRVITKTVSGVGTSTFQYDVTTGMTAGYVAEITVDSESNSNTKIYDPAGRLYQVVAGSDTTTYTYFDNGNRESVTYPNGLTTAYTYYDDNRLNTMSNKNGSTVLSAFNYAYDANGNLEAKLDNNGTTSYTYDDLNRLESVTEPGGVVTEYEFDASGNRETETVTDGSDVTLTTYNYTAQNQLETASKLMSDDSTVTTSYFYDYNGNTLSNHEETLSETTGDAGLTVSVPGDSEGASYAVYTYDVFNQMTSAVDNDSVSTFVYNGEGLRTGKTVTKDEETTTTVFVYEYDNVVLELDENGNETAYNVNGGNTLISRTSTGDGTLYYLYNGHGDVVQLTDEYGIVVMSYDYDAFGVVTEATGSITNSYLFSGYMYDEETGMYYLNARYYDPVTARFMSADTYLGDIGQPLSLNLYTYCYNEPLMNYDPTGHYVSPTDEANLSAPQITQLEQLSKDWDAANKAGNTDAMKAANEMANAIRASAGYSGGGNGNSIIVSSGNTTNTVVLNDTTTVNNSGTIVTVEVLAGATTAITNFGTIETLNNSGSISTISNLGTIKRIINSNSGNIDYISNTSSGNIDRISNDGEIGTISNSGEIGTIGNGGEVGKITNNNTIGTIRTGKSTNNIINRGAIGSIYTGSNSVANVNNTGLIRSINVGRGGTLNGTNDGFVVTTNGGTGYNLTNQWRDSSATTLLFLNNKFIQNYLLTTADLDAGVGVSRIDGNLYKDFSNPVNVALENAEQDFIDHKRDFKWFRDKVDHEAPWDIKVPEVWNETIAADTFPGSYDTEIVVNGQIITPEQLGNMTYGYLGTAAGFSQAVLIAGGNYAAGGVWGVITGADSESDKEYIKKGIEWYNNK